MMFQATLIRLSLCIITVICGTGFAQEIKGTLAWPSEWVVFPLPDPMVEGKVSKDLLKTIPKQITFDGKTITGRQIEVKGNCLDLVPLFGKLQIRNTAYVFVALNSNERQEVTLGMGADWWMQVWLNGEEIVNTLDKGNIQWPPHITNHTRNVTLQKGKNVLAVKFISGSGSSVLTLGGPEQLRKVPAAHWRNVKASVTPSNYPIVQADYSTKGITVPGAIIVLARDTIAPEETAAKELADYFRKLTGAECTIIREGEEPRSDNLIYVGLTQYARDNGIDTALLGSERWVIRTVNGNLILTGGRPRGVLYSVYHFLEDVVGVRWWNPWEEFVPKHTTLATGAINFSGEPAFRLRHLDTYNMYMTDAGTEQLWAPRNRVNLELHSTGKPEMAYKYGGGYNYGPPGFVHTESDYYTSMQQRGYLKPQWVALRDGKREIHTSGDGVHRQLCLSNQEMRKVFLKLLKEHIRNTRNREMPPMIFNISFNDTSSRCQCKRCASLVKKYGSDAGLALDFLNEMADGIKDEYPEVLISTLAYMNTQNPPVGIVPRKNIMITLCDILSTYTAPIPRDSDFAQQLQSWSAIADKLSIWDYHTNFADYALPMPFESTIQPDLQLFKKNNVVGVMTQYHSPIFEDMRDLRLWLFAKLYEDPYRDQNRLIKDFTDGFYGSAGAFVREYLKILQKAAAEHPSCINTKDMLERCRNYITPDFILKVQIIFDNAEDAVGDDKVLLRRVRHARLAIDKAAYIFFPRIVAHWTSKGGKKEDVPLNRETIAARIKQTVEQQTQLRASNLIPLGQRHFDENKNYFLEMLVKEIPWESCDSLDKETWYQVAWRPKHFKKEEIGNLKVCTEDKVEGKGSIHWMVTAKDVNKKLKEYPELKYARLSYLYGQDFARNTRVKFYIKCKSPKHPPVFASLANQIYPDILILARNEVTEGWKEIVWDLEGDPGNGWTHLYFRLYALTKEFHRDDVLDVYIDNMRVVR